MSGGRSDQRDRLDEIGADQSARAQGWVEQQQPDDDQRARPHRGHPDHDAADGADQQRGDRLDRDAEDRVAGLADDARCPVAVVLAQRHRRLADHGRHREQERNPQRHLDESPRRRSLSPMDVMMRTPPTAAGTEPITSHLTSPRLTVPRRR